MFCPNCGEVLWVGMRNEVIETKHSRIEIKDVPIMECPCCSTVHDDPEAADVRIMAYEASRKTSPTGVL